MLEIDTGLWRYWRYKYSPRSHWGGSLWRLSQVRLANCRKVRWPLLALIWPFLILLCLSRLPGKEIFSKRYTNADFPTFADALQTFLYNDAKVSHPPFTACLAIAGPVRDNRVRLTNRDSWLIDGNELAKAFHIHSVSLVNDFLAMGYGLLTLDKAKECVVLQQGEYQQSNSQPMACVGAGTGLGECYLTPDRHGKYTCFPCEGGHTDFAPRDQVTQTMRPCRNATLSRCWYVLVARRTAALY